MKKGQYSWIVVSLMSITLWSSVSAAKTEYDPTRGPLFDTIAKLDQDVFDAFNHCDAAGQLQKHAEYFTPDMEFYHDNGGVTWSRQDYIAKTQANVCGHYRRELIKGSLTVYPVKGFGAIEQGMHRFCPVTAGQCTGEANFVIIWRHLRGKWEITRVLSYGHRPLKDAEK